MPTRSATRLTSLRPTSASRASVAALSLWVIISSASASCFSVSVVPVSWARRSTVARMSTLIVL